MPQGPQVAGIDAAFAEEETAKDMRGFCMRRGHRGRHARETGREALRGRATFGRSVNQGSRRQLDEMTYYKVGKWSNKKVLQTSARRDETTIIRTAPALTQRASCGGSASRFVEEELGAAAAPAAEHWPLREAAEDCDDLASCCSEGSESTREPDCVDTSSEAGMHSEGESPLQQRPWPAASAALPFGGRLDRPKSRWEQAQVVALKSARAFELASRWAGFARRCHDLAVDRAAAPSAAAMLARILAKSEFANRGQRSLAWALARRRLPMPPVPVRRAVPRLPGGGSPAHPGLHADVLRFAQRDADGFPVCWTAARAHACGVDLPHTSSEYEAVTSYFAKTLGYSNVDVVGLTRLENSSVYSRYAAEGGETIMFHGCKTAANEQSILDDGFKVDRCVSGGANYGTWFAYNASYSHQGYVFVNGPVRRIFVCAVSYCEVKRDDPIMRVVGEDCAYPMWLLQYRIP